MNVMSLPEEEARALGVADRADAHRDRRRGDAGDLGERRGLRRHRLGRAWWCRISRARWSGRISRSCCRPARCSAAAICCLIDTLARTMAPIEIPLGILTAVIGTPFFIWLLAGMQRNWS